MPDFISYHESLTAELDSIKNRIRNLVEHWGTDGEWKEAALRTVLRRHLPGSALVGRGFVVARERASTQIDLLILKPDAPTLFRDGDLTIVTPEVPAAIVEAKTRIEGHAQWSEVLHKLAEHGRLCNQVAGNKPWLGVFAYEGDKGQADNILEAICEAWEATGIPVNSVACGNELFVRYWPKGEYEPGDDPKADANRAYWRAYDLSRLAPSYFISNLVDAICNLDRDRTDYVWFAHPGGKRPRMIAEKRGEHCERQTGSPAEGATAVSEPP